MSKEGSMQVRGRLRAVAFWAGIFVLPLACGSGGAVGGPRAEAGPVPDVVKEMLVPESPYYIIYHPPVDLAKRR
jgi:hypothetical protein